MYTKLITVYKKDPALQLACRKPASTLPGLISELRALAALYDHTRPQETLIINQNKYNNDNNEAFFTNRRYYS
jgi:hypothetical protein